MINKLKQIYMQGFEEDGEKYAEYFCNKFARNSVVFPKENPVCAGYIIQKKLSNDCKCAYFSAIATAKNERGKGNAFNLIIDMLKISSKEYPFAVLSPFNSVFYKRFGFFTTQFFQKKVVNGTNYFQENLVTKDDLDDINALFSSSICPLIDEEYLLNLIQETSVYNAVPVVLKKDGQIVGFCVKEKSSLSRIKIKGIDISNIANFNGLSYKSQEEQGQAFIQVRILSLTNFVKFLIPRKDFSFVITVKDDILAENNGNFLFECNLNKISITRTTKESVVNVDIANLVEYLFKNNYIEKFETQFIDEY